MPPKRHLNKVIERAGANYVQAIVEADNCMFIPFPGGDDLGNDCYIEFIDKDVATSFSVVGQIKSGKKYKDKTGYKIPAKKSTLEYWAAFVSPVIGLVYDDDKKCAYWLNISEYLRQNPDVLKKDNHTIRVSPDAEFSKKAFPYFKHYLIALIQEYKDFENFGRSLEAFSNFNEVRLCYDGLKSLFANHNNRVAAWRYIITSFEHIPDGWIQQTILGMLSNFTNNPDIFWNTRKPTYALYQLSTTSQSVLNFIERYFSTGAIKKAVEFLRDGINRGAFSFLVFLVLDCIADVDHTIYKMARDNGISDDERANLFWLYIHFAQHHSKDEAIKAIEHYLSEFPDEDGIFSGMKETIKTEGFIQTG